MATAPAPGLPLFYNELEPLSSQQHAEMKLRPLETAPFLATAHAVPITVEEFTTVQRYYPIVFSSGPNPVPLALMGLNEGVNMFVDAEGKPTTDAYIPAYVRRYPFMLARLAPDAEELSLCFDNSAGAVGKFDDGQPLFDGDQPSQTTKDILSFCENFETSGLQTAAFVKELQDAKLLIEGEVAIQLNEGDQPFIYRGFQMVSEEAVRELRGDQLRKMTQSGLLPLVFAHLFSLSLITTLFMRQYQDGKVPNPEFQPAEA